MRTARLAAARLTPRRLALDAVFRALRALRGADDPTDPADPADPADREGPGAALRRGPAALRRGPVPDTADDIDGAGRGALMARALMAR